MPPIINVRGEDAIFQSMCALAKDESWRNELGTKGRIWVEDNCGSYSAVTKYIDLFNKVLTKKVAL
jgi:hypothetical protein